jgi:hypothetical protein
MGVVGPRESPSRLISFFSNGAVHSHSRQFASIRGLVLSALIYVHLRLVLRFLPHLTNADV